MRYLKTSDVRQRTGWSLPKIRALIRAGKLPAVNTSLGNRPTFSVRECDLEKLLTPQCISTKKKQVAS